MNIKTDTTKTIEHARRMLISGGGYAKTRAAIALLRDLSIVQNNDKLRDMANTLYDSYSECGREALEFLHLVDMEDTTITGGTRT